MVCGPAPTMANEMLSVPALPLALVTACASEPAPVAFVFVTV